MKEPGDIVMVEGEPFVAIRSANLEHRDDNLWLSLSTGFILHHTRRKALDLNSERFEVVGNLLKIFREASESCSTKTM